MARLIGVRLTLFLRIVAFGAATFVEAGVLTVWAAMPVAVFNYMFATKYGREPGEVASTVVLSTLLSFVTLPIVLSFLL